MLRKLSSAVDSRKLRTFVKRANIMQSMNVHQTGTDANLIYGQLAARPKTNNRVATRFPLMDRQLPPPRPASGHLGIH